MSFSWDFHEKEIRSVCFKICSGAYNQWLTLYTCNCALSVNTYDNRQNTVQWNPALRTPVYNGHVLFVLTESSYHFFPKINLLNTDTSLYGQQTTHTVYSLCHNHVLIPKYMCFENFLKIKNLIIIHVHLCIK